MKRGNGGDDDLSIENLLKEDDSSKDDDREDAPLQLPQQRFIQVNWKRVAHKHYGKMIKYARRLCWRMQLASTFAEDAVQEAILRAMARGVEDLGLRNGEVRLVYRIVLTLCRRECTHVHRLMPLELPAVPDAEERRSRLAPIDTLVLDKPSPDQELIARDRQNLARLDLRCVELAREHMPIYCQNGERVRRRLEACVRLRHEGVPAEELAKELHAPTPNTVRAWARRGSYHFRGWIHAYLGSRPMDAGWDRQTRQFWSLGFNAARTCREIRPDLDPTLDPAEGPQ